MHYGRGLWRIWVQVRCASWLALIIWHLLQCNRMVPEIIYADLGLIQHAWQHQALETQLYTCMWGLWAFLIFLVGFKNNLQMKAVELTMVIILWKKISIILCTKESAGGQPGDGIGETPGDGLSEAPGGEQGVAQGRGLGESPGDGLGEAQGDGPGEEPG